MTTLAKYAKWLLIIGGGILAAGEFIGAFFDNKPGGTISEAYRDAPEPIKAFTVFGMGAVFAHFVWPMPPRPNVTIAGDMNVQVEKGAGDG